MGRVKTAFSCDWQEVNHAFRSVFSCFYVVHEGQFYSDFEFSLGSTVYSWHVGVPKKKVPQRQPFFPVISTPSLSTHLFSPTGLFQLHLPPIATAMCVRTSKWGHSIFVRFLGKMSTDREHWLWSYASTSRWCQYEPTPPLRDVTHLQRSMTYVRTCKWTCRGVTSWECASTWTLLPHPTPPQGTYKQMPKTLGRFSTRRHKHQGILSWWWPESLRSNLTYLCRNDGHLGMIPLPNHNIWWRGSELLLL